MNRQTFARDNRLKPLRKLEISICITAGEIWFGHARAQHARMTFPWSYQFVAGLSGTNNTSEAERSRVTEEGVGHCNSHSLEEMQKQKLLLHVRIL
ncbi:hypothetical protein EVAR_27940_1 [Eumeta japonica]|uniref:Uncharacterized protein n=1 Tax=Eumeta variegata TaxID=151549 RepID=A0A4C1UWD3_EUMVA|nr:hypothetical protein EVAR_27940_1 [Eumeta japonica]